MSRTRSSALALLLALSAGMPAWAVAQTTDMTQEELVAEIERLIPLVEEAADDAERAMIERDQRVRAESEAAGQLDTLLVGDLRVITTVELRNAAQGFFQEVWDEDVSHLDSEELREWIFTFQSRDRLRPIYVEQEKRRDVHVSRWLTYDQSRQRVWDQVVAAAYAAILAEHHPVHVWAPVNPLASAELRDIYRAVATAPSQASRACLAGDIDQCVDALGLNGYDDGVLERWYNRDELVVAAARGAGHTRQGLGNRDLCVAGEFSACQMLLDALPDPHLVAPYAGFVHASVVSVALELGGDGAWNRYVERADHSPREVLEYVSGVSTHELVSEWRDRVVANRQQVYAGLGGRSLLALLWVLAFTAMAMRSTRWRLG